MTTRVQRLLQIKHCFALVLVLIQALIFTLTVLLTRLALQNIRQTEADKRTAIVTFVTHAVERGTAGAESAVATLAANERYMLLFARHDRPGLLSATRPLFDRLNQLDGIRQMQFTAADFKVLLRVDDPALFGDDITNTRPTLVECITGRQGVKGLEQARTGYALRAVVPAFGAGSFIGCLELGLDFNQRFLESLNANYPGHWAIVNLDTGTHLTRDLSVLATLNEPVDAAIRALDYSTPDAILHTLRGSETYTTYFKDSEEVAFYIPIRNFKGEVALYIRYVSPTPYYATVRRMVASALVISLIGMALAGIALLALYRGIRVPVHRLVLETEKINGLDLKDDVAISASLLEMGKLIQSVADMKMGLRSFQKYVPANLVRQLIDTHQEARIGGRLKELTVFFSDIANFTDITEDMSPNELTLQLSEYFTQVTDIILAHQGTVDKYIGDAVMAFWGAPLDLEDHALFACRAALRCSREIHRLSSRWKGEGRYEFHTRIGLSTGEMVVGNIGSDQRMNYSVIGDTVNLASRLESLNKVYKTGILISQPTYQRCAAHIEARPIDFVTVKGKQEPVRIYELIGERGDISPRRKESLKLFERALDAYMMWEFPLALTLLQQLRDRDPEDAVIPMYIERCRRFIGTPPQPGWRGEYHYHTK